jgi:hypothetical protein
VQVACEGCEENRVQGFVGKTDGMHPLRVRRNRWKYNIEMDLK